MHFNHPWYPSQYFPPHHQCLQLSHILHHQRQIAHSLCMCNNSNMEGDFIDAAANIIKVPKSRNSTFVRRWMGAFGTSPAICCWLWDRLDPVNTMPSGVQIKHLLWALFFLKVYETEENSANAGGKVDEKTYRGWCWRFVEAISYLECDVVSCTFDPDVSTI